jgi:hypothetical protein
MDDDEVYISENAGFWKSGSIFMFELWDRLVLCSLSPLFFVILLLHLLFPFEW